MNFYETITAAINDVAAHGYDSQARIDRWLAAIRKAARASLVGEHKMQKTMRATLTTIYRRMVDQKGVYKYQAGDVPMYTLMHVKPKLRAELDRRIAASADLIRLNREAAIEKTLQRFQGWSTSIPKGGSRAVDRPDTKADVRKSLSQLPFEERRVIIDQGHKLAAAINDIVAKDAGALAAEWHATHQKGYNNREDHLERDQHVYLIRGSWAQQKGLVKVGPAGYVDQITMPGEEVFCRCHYVYLHSLSSLPVELLTEKGVAELARITKELAA